MYISKRARVEELTHEDYLEAAERCCRTPMSDCDNCPMQFIQECNDLLMRYLLKKVKENDWVDLTVYPDNRPPMFEDVEVCLGYGDDEEYDYDISHYGVISPFNREPCKMWARSNTIAYRRITPFKKKDK